jgi:hypothetical protein
VEAYREYSSLSLTISRADDRLIENTAGEDEHEPAKTMDSLSSDVQQQWEVISVGGLLTSGGLLAYRARCVVSPSRHHLHGA